MLRTISVGSCVSIQGLLVGQMADGKIVVKVDEKTFVGYPVNRAKAFLNPRRSVKKKAGFPRPFLFGQPPSAGEP